MMTKITTTLLRSSETILGVDSLKKLRCRIRSHVYYMCVNKIVNGHTYVSHFILLKWFHQNIKLSTSVEVSMLGFDKDSSFLGYLPELNLRSLHISHLSQRRDK